jgi:hypothetical protein
MYPLAADADPIGVKAPPAGVALGSISIAQSIFNVLELVKTQVEADEQSSDQIVAGAVEVAEGVKLGVVDIVEYPFVKLSFGMFTKFDCAKVATANSSAQAESKIFFIFLFFELFNWLQI